MSWRTLYRRTAALVEDPRGGVKEMIDAPRRAPQSALATMRRDTRRWLTIGTLSVVFHGLLGWALLIGVPVAPTLVEPHSVEVQLLAPKPPETPDRDKPRPAARPSTPIAHVAPARPLPANTPTIPAPPRPAAAPTGEIVAPPGFTARGTLTGGGEALRQAARKSACTEADIVKLTKAERAACAEALGAKNKNGPALYAAIDPDKKAAFDGDCKKDDDWCLYRTGKGPYPGIFALGKKKKRPGWDD
jgi:hypothetical protein